MVSLLPGARGCRSPRSCWSTHAALPYWVLYKKQVFLRAMFLYLLERQTWTRISHLLLMPPVPTGAGAGPGQSQDPEDKSICVLGSGRAAISLSVNHQTELGGTQCGGAARGQGLCQAMASSSLPLAASRTDLRLPLSVPSSLGCPVTHSGVLGQGAALLFLP